VIHAGLGNVEAALTALAAAIEDRSWRIAWLPVDPMLDAVRNDARFQTLLARAAEPQLPI
jgi:hypothetical protein